MTNTAEQTESDTGIKQPLYHFHILGKKERYAIKSGEKIKA